MSYRSVELLIEDLLGGLKSSSPQESQEIPGGFYVPFDPRGDPEDITNCDIL